MRILLLLVCCASAYGEDLTALLGAQERQFYEDWKNKSVKAFENNLAEDAIAFTPYGTFDRKTQLEQQTHASSICEVRSFAFSDVHAQTVTKDSAILTYRVQQDAVCGGQAVPSPLLNTSVYARRGKQWKVVFRTSQPALSTPNR